MINLQMAVIFLMDVIEIILTFTLILGFTFRKGKRYYVAAAGVVVCCVLVILGLRDLSNHIFLSLTAHILLAAVLFDGKKVILGELAILVHFLISIVDAFCMGITLLFLKGQHLVPESNRLFEVIANSIGMVIIFVTILLCCKKRKIVRTYLTQFNLKKFLYYFLYIIASGIIIGFAEIVALDADIVYRLRAVFVIGASLFGILIIASSIMIDVLLLQKARLRELARENEKCIEEQTRQYLLLNKKQVELRKFRHDYNAHMNALQWLSSQEESEKVHRYIADMQEMKKSFDYVITGNVIGDAVINEFYEKGLEENIDVKVIGKFPCELRIKETDLCVLLSNTVKNAYEAAQKCDENRKILISIGVSLEKVLITIKNPVREQPIIKAGVIETMKSDGDDHGIGLRNVSAVIKRNNAGFQMKYVNGMMITEILL